MLLSKIITVIGTTVFFSSTSTAGPIMSRGDVSQALATFQDLTSQAVAAVVTVSTITESNALPLTITAIYATEAALVTLDASFLSHTTRKKRAPQISDLNGTAMASAVSLFINASRGLLLDLVNRAPIIIQADRGLQFVDDISAFKTGAIDQVESSKTWMTDPEEIQNIDAQAAELSKSFDATIEAFKAQ